MATNNRNVQANAPLRVLVVEDSPIVALAIEEMLQEFGMFPIGPFANMAAARNATEDEHLDAAIVDLNPGSESVLTFQRPRSPPDPVHHCQRLRRLNHARWVARSVTVTQTIH
jgi:CheY-like chemotaxis protein